jgi:hypothetical protein
MTVEIITREQVLVLARRLSPADQAYVVAALAPGIAGALEHVTTSKPKGDGWDRWDRLREEFRALGPSERTLAEQLEEDRRSREESLIGRREDVHS